MAAHAVASIICEALPEGHHERAAADAAQVERGVGPRRHRLQAGAAHSSTFGLNVGTFGGVGRVVSPCFSDKSGSG